MCDPYTSPVSWWFSRSGHRKINSEVQKSLLNNMAKVFIDILGYPFITRSLIRITISFIQVSYNFWQFFPLPLSLSLSLVLFSSGFVSGIQRDSVCYGRSYKLPSNLFPTQSNDRVYHSPRRGVMNLLIDKGMVSNDSDFNNDTAYLYNQKLFQIKWFQIHKMKPERDSSSQKKKFIKGNIFSWNQYSVTCHAHCKPQLACSLTQYKLKNIVGPKLRPMLPFQSWVFQLLGIKLS